MEYGKIPGNTSRSLSQARLREVPRKYTSITVPPSSHHHPFLLCKAPSNITTMEISAALVGRVTCVIALCLLVEGCTFPPFHSFKWAVEVVVSLLYASPKLRRSFTSTVSCLYQHLHSFARALLSFSSDHKAQSSLFAAACTMAPPVIGPNT